MRPEQVLWQHTPLVSLRSDQSRLGLWPQRQLGLKAPIRRTARETFLPKSESSDRWSIQTGTCKRRQRHAVGACCGAYTSSPAAVEHSNDASSYGIDGAERSSCDDSMRHDRWYVRDERREQAHVGSLGALKRCCAPSCVREQCRRELSRSLIFNWVEDSTAVMRMESSSYT